MKTTPYEKDYLDELHEALQNAGHRAACLENERDALRAELSANRAELARCNDRAKAFRRIIDGHVGPDCCSPPMVALAAELRAELEKR